MILLIAGATHTGKTLLAQRLLERYHYPCLSIDHLKMGLIRSGQTRLTAENSTEALTEYLWPILRGMIKTALENGQNLILEGSYIPFDWDKSFTPEERQQMRYICLVMSEHYIHSHYADILVHANDIEHRMPGPVCSLKSLLNENAETRVSCRLHGAKLFRIDEEYPSADEMITALME